MKPSPIRPATDFPIGSKVTLLDAWMRNPRKVRITKHPDYAPDSIISEDIHGVVYFAKTERIVGEAKIPIRDIEIDELLGDTSPPSKSQNISIEDLVG